MISSKIVFFYDWNFTSVAWDSVNASDSNSVMTLVIAGFLLLPHMSWISGRQSLQNLQCHHITHAIVAWDVMTESGSLSLQVFTSRHITQVTVPWDFRVQIIPLVKMLAQHSGHSSLGCHDGVRALVIKGFHMTPHYMGKKCLGCHDSIRTIDGHPRISHDSTSPASFNITSTTWGGLYIK